MALAVLLPIVALVASYMAIVGERQSGGLKFLLGFPNTRREVILGKLASRLAVVWGVLAFVFLTAASLSHARHGVLPLGTVVGLFALSLLYGGVFVTVAVAMSAGIASRGRAIAAAVGSYFVLVLLYAVPTFRFSTIVRFLHQDLFGLEANYDLYNAITYTSPFTAFRKGMNLVVPADLERTVFRRPRPSPESANLQEGAGAASPPDLPVYLTDEFALVVLAVWIVVPLAVGALRFERGDLA
jgi:ABC-2 type transport system permease protein